MRSNSYRVLALGITAASLILITGCEEDKSKAAVPVYSNVSTARTGSDVATPVVEPAIPAPVMLASTGVIDTSPSIDIPPAEIKPIAATDPVQMIPASLTEPTTNANALASEALTNAPALQVEAADTTGAGDTNATILEVQGTIPPEDLNLSPALQEVVKLAQSRVGEEVLLAYVTNTHRVYELDSDKIIYLNDIGLSSTVITALIQQDSSPDSAARKALTETVKNLPPGASLSSPATNVYPAGINPTNYVWSDMPPAVAETAPAATAAAPAELPAGASTNNVADVSSFYGSLAPYGTWMNIPEYGTVWQPSVVVINSGWRPYADGGRWLWTDYGWYWYSDYSWGWAPFHYGRWGHHHHHGWFWVPDRHWGPSWVTWRHTPYHAAWAPLPPSCHYVPGFGLYYRHSSVGIGFDFGFGADYYTWVHLNRFCDPYPYRYYIPRHQLHHIHRDSVPYNSYAARRGGHGPRNEGLPYTKVARATRGNIPEVAVQPQQLRNRPQGRVERLGGSPGRPAVVSATLPPVPAQSGVTTAAGPSVRVGSGRARDLSQNEGGRNSQVANPRQGRANGSAPASGLAGRPGNGQARPQAGGASPTAPTPVNPRNPVTSPAPPIAGGPNAPGRAETGERITRPPASAPVQAPNGAGNAERPPRPAQNNLAENRPNAGANRAPVVQSPRANANQGLGGRVERPAVTAPPRINTPVTPPRAPNTSVTPPPSSRTFGNPGASSFSPTPRPNAPVAPPRAEYRPTPAAPTFAAPRSPSPQMAAPRSSPVPQRVDSPAPRMSAPAPRVSPPPMMSAPAPRMAAPPMAAPRMSPPPMAAPAPRMSAPPMSAPARVAPPPSGPMRSGPPPSSGGGGGRRNRD